MSKFKTSISTDPNGATTSTTTSASSTIGGCDVPTFLPEIRNSQSIFECDLVEYGLRAIYVRADTGTK
jgi:hypothetical protein